ncbi:Tyrosine recombinase slr0733 [Labeo rohita]|uniref:Tyrosine recombinase slr0733 n=1 Tax=Labeo rohita TaxID=84645 RepID=A0ABQ8MAE9_LABRO|nr:Tyrosine recombinase slr0733 [Labeo rohita]
MTTSTSPLPVEGRELSQKKSILSPPGFRPRVPSLSSAQEVSPRIRTRSLMSPAREPGKKVSAAQCSLTFLQDVLPSGISPLPLPPPGCPTAVTSVNVPLIPLVTRLGAWLQLPSPSRWLIRTVCLGYAIQFARRTPRYRGVLSTSVHLDTHAAVLRAEVAVLLAKDAIEPVPPAEMKSGFYSPYFIVPKKSGGLRPILDLRALNRSLLRLPFKMLTTKRMLTCIRDRLRPLENMRPLQEERPSFSGDGHNLAPAPRPAEPARLVPGRDASDLSGLPQAVIETITQSRAPSTRQAYALRWGLFVDWCSSRGEDPQRCTIAVVLPFLQEKLERRLSPSTLKVYVAAIAAYHDAVDGTSLGKHQLIMRFLRGARRVNPPRPHPIPSWDLSVALQGLREAPFEPLASVELKYLSLKTALLTALASIKRVGDLQAFSVYEACLEFGPGDSHVILRPRPGYVPKVPTTPFRDQVVNLQALPLEEADPASALLCPVRALRIYVDCTRHFRRTEQLFVCFGGQQKGNAVSKQRLAHWVVDAISLSYQNQGEPCPLGVCAHSTRSVASSYAMAHGASLADICRAAGWATPNTFARFYNLRVEAVSSLVLHAPQSGLVRSSACLCSGWVSFAQQVMATCFSIFPRDFMCSAPPTPVSVQLASLWGPLLAPRALGRLRSYPSADTSACRHAVCCVTRRLEGTETLHPLPRPDVALTPGCSSAPQQKPE